METTKFLGINFRSAHHRHHFASSMIMLFGSLIIGVILVMLTGFYGLAVAVWGILGVVFGVLSVCAIIVTDCGKKNGPEWSVDCIWFNGLLAVIYLSGTVLCFVLQRPL